MFSYPFRVYANANLGSQFDNTSFTGEWLSSAGVGQSRVLPQINVATGNLIVPSYLVKTEERIGNFDFGFVYNAQNKTPWAPNIPEITSADDNEIYLREQDGSLIAYSWDNKQNAFVSPDGAASKYFITKNSDNTFTKFNPDSGEKTIFGANKKIQSVTDRRGFSMQYTYDSDNNLKTIESDAGTYTIATSNQITTFSFTKKNETESTLLGTWIFDNQQRLQSVTVPTTDQYQINYAYVGNTNQLQNIVQSDNTVINFLYTTDTTPKIKSLQVGANGGAYQFQYNDQQTVITDALGFSQTAAFNDHSLIQTWTTQCGDTVSDAISLTTKCDYAGSVLQSITKPNGAKKIWSLTDSGLISKFIGANNQLTEYQYDSVNHACVIKREATSSTDQTWSVTRYVYMTNAAGVQLAFVVSPTGTVTQYDYADDASQTTIRTYLKAAFDVSTIPDTQTLTYDDMVAWAALQAKDSVSLMVIDRNLRDQHEKVQRFSAVDSNGNGIATEDASSITSEFTLWGAATSVTEKLDTNRSAITTAQFDALYRNTESINACSESKENKFSSNACVTTQPNGRKETHTKDDTGLENLISISIPDSDVTRTIAKQRDAIGRVIAVQDIDGTTSYQLFDSLNRVRFSITAEGRVSQTIYDDLHSYTQIIEYYNQVPVNNLTAPPTFSWMQQSLQRDAKRDVSTYQFFDTSHRLRFSIDGRGAITEKRYDVKNRVTTDIIYADFITPDELSSLVIDSFSRVPAAHDHSTLYFYDNDDRVIATQDAAGYVVTHQYSAAGFEVARYSFATPIALMWNGILQLPNTSPDDYPQFFYRNAKNKIILTVDGVDGAYYAIAQDYYPNGKPKTTTAFANPSPVAPTVDSDPATLIPKSNSEDQITTNSYDLLARVIATLLPNQCSHTIAYDNMNHSVLESISDDTDEHTTAKRFNTWGDCIAEATPLVYEKIAAILYNSHLTPDEKTAQVNAVWENQALRYVFDEQTGLHLATLDIRPDDATADASTYFFYDKDKRVVLIIGPDGQATQKKLEAIFSKPEKLKRFAQGVDATQLPQFGGFISDAVLALLISDAGHDAIDQFQYDAGGAVCDHIDPDGYETITHYHAFNLWDKKQVPVHDTSPTLQINREINAKKQITQITKTTASDSIATQKEYNNLHGLCTKSIDGNGAETTMTYQPRGTLATKTDALKRTTSFAHDAFKRETGRTLPMKQSIQTVYNQRVTQKSIVDEDNNVISSTKDTADAFGNIIQHQDTMGNIFLTEYNAENAWEQKTDALNNTESRWHDLRNLPRTHDISGAQCFSNTNTMDYTQSRLLKTHVKDDGGFSYKTSQHWNPLNVRDQVTAANDAVRKIVSNKRGLATEHHALLNAADPNSASVVTTQNYNGLEKISALSHSTTDQEKSYTEETEHDDFGRPAKKIVDPKGLKLTRETIFDHCNRTIAKKDPKGQITFYVRDIVGNIRYSINPKGGVTEYQYNANNKATVILQYMKAIDLTTVSPGISESAVAALITQTPYDRQTYYFYDAANRERFRLCGAGAIVETRYNTNEKEIATIQYKTPTTVDPAALSTKKLETLCQTLRDVAHDKATFRVLDAIGQERFVIDAEGFVTEKRYCSIPHAVNWEIRYATAVADPEAFSQLSIDQITQQLVTTGEDRHTYWIPDDLNRLHFHVAANGAVIRYDYDGDSKRKLSTTEFTSGISINPHYPMMLNILYQLTPDPSKDNILTCAYDQAGRLLSRTNALKISETWEYDGASRKTYYTTLSGHTWHYESDGANRMTDEFSPTTTAYFSNVDPNTGKIVVSQQTLSVAKKTEFDANDLPIQITSGVGTSDELPVFFDYDGLDKKIKDQWNLVPVDDPTQPASMTTRPEILQTLNRQTFFGAHGHQLVKMNEAGNPQYYVYNTQGFLQYRVNAEGYVIEYQRNVFGEAECFTFYDKQLTIDITQYITTGLTPDVIQNALIKDETKDHHYRCRFNRVGKLIETKRDAVVCYIPNINPAIAPSISVQAPTQQYRYNAFREKISDAVAIDQNNNRWKKTLYWYDKQGKKIAEINPNGAATVITRNVKGKKIDEYQYATKIPAAQMPAETISFLDLLTLLSTFTDSVNDRHFIYTRDILNRKTGKLHQNVVTQAVTAGQPIVDNAPATLSETYTYTADNLIKSITHANGSQEIFYYDERRYLVAKAGVARTQTKPDGTTTQLRPITYYHHSMHGDKVETYLPDSGCAVTLDPASDAIPAPIVVSDQDRYHRFLRDPKRRIIMKQDPENNLRIMTFTKTSKLARKYHETQNANADSTKNYRETHIDEHRMGYDKIDRKTSSANYRDNTLLNTHALQRDAFSVTAEGPGDGTWPVQHKSNQAGQEWLTTDENGAAKLRACDSSGTETVSILSLTQDLSTVTDIQPILNNRDNVNDYAFSEIVPDDGGRPIGLVEPGYLDSNNQPTLAPKSILFCGNCVSVAAHIDPKKYAMKLIISAEGFSDRIISMNYKKEDNRFYADLSDLPQGAYSVSLKHVLKPRYAVDQEKEITPLSWKFLLDWPRKINHAVAARSSSVIELTHPFELPENPQLHVWIEHYGQPGKWELQKEVVIDRASRQLKIDARHLPRDIYRYHLGDKNIHTFSAIANDESAFFAESNVGADTIIRPLIQPEWNNFNKKSAVVTPALNRTEFKRNQSHKVVLQTDPAITVVDEHGTASIVQPQTKTGYNEMAGKIGVQDANNHTEATIRDEANQEVERIAADGTPYFKNTLNTFGEAIQVTSASGNTWNKTFNRKGKITQVTMPSGDAWNYCFNGNGFAIEITPPAGSVTGVKRYAQGPYGDMSAEFLPMGESHEYEHDPHHQILVHTAKGTDGTVVYTVTMTRDFWGKMQSKIDGSNSQYQYLYNFAALISAELGISVNHGNMLAFDTTTNTFSNTPVATPLQNKIYGYLTPLRLKTIVDTNTVHPQSLVKLFDIERNPIFLEEKTGAGNILRQTSMTYNAMKWASTQVDQGFSLATDYDAVSNRRRMNASFKPVSGDLATHDGWWTNDDADRVLINDGVMGRDGNITTIFRWPYMTQVTQGSLLSYGAQLLQTQSPVIVPFMNTTTGPSASSLIIQHDTCDRLSSVLADPLGPPYVGATKTFQYTPDSLDDTTYLDAGNGNSQSSKNQYNLNGNLTDSDDHEIYQTAHAMFDKGFNVDGLPLHSHSSVNRRGDVVDDDLTMKLTCFDQTVIAEITGTRTNQSGQSQVTSDRYYEANTQLSAVTGVKNPFNRNSEDSRTIFFNTSLNGPCLSETVVSINSSSGAATVCDAAQFFPDPAGNIVAEYRTFQEPYWGETRMILQMIANPIRGLQLSDISSRSSTLILPNDTWDTIAQRLFGDASYAPIVQAYSGSVLAPGQCISTQTIIAAHNKARNFTSYQKFMSTLYNQLYPALKTPVPPPPPPHHENFWDEVLGAVAAIVIMCFAPAAGIAIFGAAFATSVGGTIMLTAVAGALADAAQQGIAIAFGDSHHFSVTEMMENGIAAGATAGFQNAFKIQTLLNDGKYVKAFAESAVIGASMQVLQMSLGLRKSFDLKFIIEQAAATVIDGAIKNKLVKAPGLVTQGADELANFGLNEAIGCHVSAQDLAASCLGDVAQDVADPLAKHMDKKESNNANIKPKNTNPRSPKAPESYDNHSRSTHIHPTYNPDDDIAQQYQKMMDDNWDQQISSIEDGTSELNYNTYASGSASLNREPRALASEISIASALPSNLPQAQTTTGNGFEDWISQELYTHENSNIAKGILDVFAGLNSNAAHMIMHGLAPDHAMNPTVALREAYSKIDPITGHSVTEGQAYTDAAIAAATFAFGGEFDSIANKVIHGVDSLIAGTSSVAKNWASMFGSREVNALSPMRLRVMDNVTASKFARAETGYPVLEAKIDQISHGYSADTWEMTTLRAGDVVYGGIPGQSAFYTDFETALGAAGNKEVLGENLQIQPHPIRGYRSNIAAYKVVNDARIPSSVVHANPQFGVGGGRQFFIDNYSCALRLENEFNLEEFYNENQLPTNRFRP